MNKYLFGISNNKLKFIVFTAINLSITIILQYLSGLLGIQLLTGSIVNMMLLINTMFVGLIGGALIGLVTPFIGLALGIAGNIMVVPFIAVSNVLYVLSFMFMTKLFKVGNKNKVLNIIFTILAVIIASIIKFMFIYFVGLKLFLPIIMAKIPPVLTTTLGITQLFTALIGGSMFIIISHILKKSLKHLSL